MKQMHFIILSLLLCFTACRNSGELQSLQGTALGTVYEVLYVGPQDERLGLQVDSLLQAFEHTYSIFDTASLISRINRNETDSLPESVENVLRRSLEISRISGGAFDITAAPLINAWGFGSEKGQRPSAAAIDSLKQLVGYSGLHIGGHRLIKDDARMQLNLNAIAKGHIVDCLADFIRERHPDFLVNIGGEIVCEGRRPDGKNWNIGIQLPTADSLDEGTVFHRFQLPEGKAVATSGDYRRYHTDSTGRRFSHIIDPQTGCSGQSDILSATVIAEDCMTADALATACMVMGRKAALRLLEQHDGWAACFICHENGKWRVYTTPNFPESIR